MVKTPKPQKKGFTVYGRAGCPYCDRTVELLKTSGERFKYFQRERLEASRYQFHEDLAKYIGNYGKTFPLIFYNGKFIGGYSELKKSMDRLGLTDDF